MSNGYIITPVIGPIKLGIETESGKQLDFIHTYTHFPTAVRLNAIDSYERSIYERKACEVGCTSYFYNVHSITITCRNGKEIEFEQAKHCNDIDEIENKILDYWKLTDTLLTEGAKWND